MLTTVPRHKHTGLQREHDSGGDAATSLNLLGMKELVIILFIIMTKSSATMLLQMTQNNTTENTTTKAPVITKTENRNSLLQ